MQPEPGVDTPETSTHTARQSIATIAGQRPLRIASAESLTGGLLASELARAPEASNWYRGGIVAYAAQIKHDVLGVRAGPVVSKRAVLEMADGVARLLDANTTVAVSGVGGPDDLEGNPPGTVWCAVRHELTTRTERFDFAGSPDEICRQTCAAALKLLEAVLSGDASRADPA